MPFRETRPRGPIGAMFSSPGPVYYPDPKCTHRGKDGTPHYSLYSRRKNAPSEITPGPDAYVSDKMEVSNYIRQPAYSFGAKRFADDQPGSDKSTADPTVTATGGPGKTGRFHDDLAKTPGPGHYSTTNADTYLTKPPVYSMTSRRERLSDHTQKPGPGSHSPEKVTLDRTSVPKYTFGYRHSPYIEPVKEAK